MCGIVGYIGTKQARPILINGLLKLEYRGYDSAGISTIEKNNIEVVKNRGRVKELKKIDGIKNLKGTVGIAHTRWATHGKPSNENSHPHTDNSKTFSLVHNGIIENYNELRNFLEKKGYKFYSETDTEVIPNLIHYYYSKNNNFLKSVHLAIKELKGSYAIEVISKLEPDTIIVARKDSPLVIGTGNDENYICSDMPAVLEYTKNFYLLDDGEIAEVKKDVVKIYNEELRLVNKKVQEFNLDISEMEKGKYEDFMLKEINEQAKTVKETIGSKLSHEEIDFSEISFTKEYLLSLKKVYIVACGTAMHAGLATKKIFEKFLNISVEIDIASEFRYRGPLIDKDTLVIFVTQSGETADTIAATKLAKRKGAKTIAISNVMGSSITREAKCTIYTHAGIEIAVASTKAYTAQIVLLTLLAMYFGEILGDEKHKKEIDKLKKDILKLPNQISEILEDTEHIKKFAKKVSREKDVFFIGRGVDYGVSLEGALKLKEISYIHSEGYASGELKHGPIALIEEGVTVIATITDPKLIEKTMSNVQEVITRGAKILVVTNQNIEGNDYDEIIKIPKTNTLISPVLSVIPLQLFSYYIAKEKGLDVDKPRNLAKSVTVE